MRKWPMGASFHRTIIEWERILAAGTPPPLLEDEVEPLVEAGTIVSYSSNLQEKRTVLHSPEFQQTDLRLKPQVLWLPQRLELLVEEREDPEGLRDAACLGQQIEQKLQILQSSPTMVGMKTCLMTLNNLKLFLKKD